MAGANEMPLSGQESGRHDLVLLADGDEIARQPLLIGPAEVFRATGT